MVIKQEKCSQLVHIPHLFHPVGVLLSSALADVHLCCVDTAWLWGGGGGGGQGAQVLGPDGLYSRLILLTSAQYCVCTHHRPMDVPECPLLAVQDLPLRLVLLPVNPAISRKKPQRTCLAKIRDGTQTCGYSRQRGQSSHGTCLLASAVEAWTDLNLHN